jgi:hypothetical protein
MLYAVQKRRSKEYLPDLESLKIIADKAATLLPLPRRPDLIVRCVETKIMEASATQRGFS